MGRVMVLIVVLLCARAAHAGPVGHVRWSACAADGGARVESFDCSTNAGTHEAVFTLVADEPIADITGVRALLLSEDFCPCWAVCSRTGSTTLFNVTPWWQLGPGQCRAGALSASIDFTESSWTESGNCPDLWMGAGAPYLYNLPTLSVSAGVQVVMDAEIHTDPGQHYAVEPGVEYHVLRFTLRNSRTTGAGSCLGCCGSMSFCPFLYIWRGANRTEVTIDRPNEGLGWRTNGTYCTTPAPNRTWGTVKQLYR